MNAKKRALIAASVAGLMAATAVGTAHGAEGAAAPAGKVPCYGINKCKGAGDCGGKGNSCAGKNACKGTAFIKLEKDTCLKIQGGRLTPEVVKS